MKFNRGGKQGIKGGHGKGGNGKPFRGGHSGGGGRGGRDGPVLGRVHDPSKNPKQQR